MVFQTLLKQKEGIVKMRKIPVIVILSCLVLSLAGCATIQVTINPDGKKQKESQVTEKKENKSGKTEEKQKETEEKQSETEESQSEEMEFEESYMPGWVTGASLSTYVYYARVIYDSTQGTNVVAVGCTVSNNSNENIYFSAGNYFSLNNNGVITYARPTDYDNTTLAPGGNFFAEILFDCPTATKSGDTLHMTMIMDNAQIHLGAMPQDEKSSHEFSGIYMSSSPSYDAILIITDSGDGTYNIIRISDALSDLYQYTGVTVNDQNKFSVGNGEYLWDSENCCFYRYDDYDEKYDKDDPFVKQWFY